ncbi:MAG: peptidase M14 [Ruminococcaceae bacterium]|nr:peptidase M14 [Oscillospiraceae bacterium]
MDKNFYKNEIDHKSLLIALNTLSKKYDKLFMTTIGSSLLGKPIPAVRIGEGKSKLLYVGTHHGMERITTGILIRFLEELCEYLSYSRMIYGVSSEYILKTRCIYMIPMLNPDGADIQLHGVTEDNIMYQRLIEMNNKSSDFSHWQANARGVDLNHNYNAGFEEYKNIEKELGIYGGSATRYSGEYPESEPETSAITAFIRTLSPFKYIFTLHTQGEEIYSGYNGHEPKGSRRAASVLANASGYTLCQPESGAASYGGLKDWYVSEYDAPAYTIECGRGTNPLPPSDLIPIYVSIRKMLFKSLIL